MGKRITFKDLVMQVDKDQALTYLIDNMCSFDNDVSSKDIYEKGSNVLDVLRTMEPVENNDLELAVWHGLTEDHEVGLDVSGIGYNEMFDDRICHAIEEMPWNEWLGMPVEEDTLKQLTPAQIVGYSIYEMTFFGWTEQQIRDHMSELTEQKE